MSSQMCCLNQEERKGEIEERRVTLTSYHMKGLQMAFSPEMSPYSEPSSLRDVSQARLLISTLSPKQA